MICAALVESSLLFLPSADVASVWDFDAAVERRDTVAECLGRPFKMRELEVKLSGFSGQIDYGTDHVRFYLEKKL